MIIVYSTFPNEESAIEVGKKLLERRLIACFNVFELRSGYRWEGKIVEDREWAIIFKTTEEKESTLYEEIKKLHPYEVPAIFTLRIENVLPEYLIWLKKEVEDPQ
ncbi:divalent-cation tolerance protein CutA [Thermotoga sp. KOL6]|uniref:divalent-cation tolerance protein CutA n=1 Tax=Thermotoga sp. KOL6 TaxID=126741 RepID=UPI000C78DE64|nr:divalent-cation tolerance protein CutA [Thermotoga sp. KOL6]PLV59807.1 cation tolerance protein CutA [Thermotoga sp. KOL6]